MGVAAYNRGSKILAREADERMSAIAARADVRAVLEENARLKQTIAKLEKDLRRATICIALGRAAHEARMAEYRAEVSTNQVARKILCRLAFPQDHQDGPDLESTPAK